VIQKLTNCSLDKLET
jgi:hypothetical protein